MKGGLYHCRYIQVVVMHTAGEEVSPLVVNELEIIMLLPKKTEGTFDVFCQNKLNQAKL